MCWFDDQQPFADELDVPATMALLAQAGHQPELLATVADRVRRETPGPGVPDATAWLAVHLEAAIAADETELFAALGSLAPLARAVLEDVVRHRGDRFSPFVQATLRAYAQCLGEPGGDASPLPTASAVRRALEAFQDAFLVWKSRRGAHALEESRIAELLAGDEAARWPCGRTVRPATLWM